MLVFKKKKNYGKNIPLRENSLYEYFLVMLFSIIFACAGELLTQIWDTVWLTEEEAYEQFVASFDHFVGVEIRKNPRFLETWPKFFEFMTQEKSLAERCAQIYSKAQEKQKFIELTYEYFNSMWTLFEKTP